MTTIIGQGRYRSKREARSESFEMANLFPTIVLFFFNKVCFPFDERVVIVLDQCKIEMVLFVNDCNLNSPCQIQVQNGFFFVI